MRTYDSPYLADGFAIFLRWVTLIGMLISIGMSGRFSLAAAWPLLLLTLWNLGMTFLVAFSARLSGHRLINVAVDLTLTVAFFLLQGGVVGAATWGMILPILTAAVYFELWGSILVAVLLVAVLAGESWWRSGVLSLSYPLMLWSVIFVVLGILFGILGQRLAVHLQKTYQTWQEKREREKHIENERLRAIYELSSALSATLNYKRVLDAAIDLSYRALNPDPEQNGDDRLVSAVLLFKGDQLYVGSARRFTNADLKVTLPAAEGTLKKVFDEGEPLLASGVGYDPELGRIIALRSCMSAYFFPLRSGLNVYGVLLFAHPDPNYFTPDRTHILDIVGRQAVIAIQNARLYQDLLEERNRMVEVHEEARKKLARDLHDGPTQSVSAIAMRINLARKLIERNPQMAVQELVKIEELAHRTTKEIRHMLFTLRPLILESQGLIAALQAMADKMRETFNQEVCIQVDPKLVSQLEMGKQGVIFYITEEAVNNARKHAHASLIEVRLQPVEPGIALLEIADNGVGFDVAAVDRSYDQRGSLGMINLRERTELVNGLLQIDSAPGKGTRVKVYIPLTEEAADRLHHPN